VNLALSLGDVQLLDCDVEEPNDHLLLKPKIVETKPVYAKIPVISEELCDLCGKCAEFCRYNALFLSSEKVVVFPELCHSCGGCSIVCPKKAITEEKREIGVVRKGFVDGGLEFVYGELNVGEPLPVPVIRMTKREINKSATGRSTITVEKRAFRFSSRYPLIEESLSYIPTEFLS